MKKYRTSAAREPIPLPNGKFKTPESVRRYTNTLKGRIKSMVKGAKASAKVKNLEFAITDDDLLAKFVSQKGRCLYTGWDMTTETRSKTLMSLERKDCNEGYTVKNTVLVCWQANRARSLLSAGEFIELCTAVYLHCGKKPGKQIYK